MQKRNLHLFYRISDQSYKKPRIPGANKDVCLLNFLKVFRKHWDNLTVIADHCSDETLETYWEWRESCGAGEIKSTRLGNAGSFRYCLEKAVEIKDDETIVYFVEDDYIHMEDTESCWPRNVPEMIFEGFKSVKWNQTGETDYVTLQDHPDKYESMYAGGESSIIWRGEASHWKQTASTTMTFAAKVKTIKEDLEVWKRYTEESHPNDHDAFRTLALEHKRKLISPIPGVAVHCDVSSSEKMTLHKNEEWVFKIIEGRLLEKTENGTELTKAFSDPMKKLAVLEMAANKKRPAY